MLLESSFCDALTNLDAVCNESIHQYIMINPLCYPGSRVKLFAYEESIYDPFYNQADKRIFLNINHARVILIF